MDFLKKLENAAPGKTHVFSAGQAGYIVKNAAGKILALDLCLSEAVEKLEGHVGFKRLLPSLFLPEELKADVLVATHPHYDHYDPEAMPGLMQHGARLFASADCAKLVKLNALDPDRVCYIRPGDRREEAGFGLHFISCDHGTGAPDAVGLILTVDGRRIVFAGDTCLREDRKEEYLADGPVDMLIAPINGAYGNLDAADCAKLSELLKAGLTVPSHYGMFASHGGDLKEYYRLMTEVYPQNSFLLMGLGEQYTFE